MVAKKLLLLSTFYTICVFCYAQQDSIVPFDKAYKRNYYTQKVNGERPIIDGRLDEDFWTKNGEWSERFVQVLPEERKVNPYTTYMKVLYDDKYIYVGVICKDIKPNKINRFIGDRDDNTLGDLISVAFDPYHDYRAAPEFNLNVGGSKTDLIVTDKLSVNKSWNAVWEGKTHVNLKDSCWTAELRIPFSQLRYNQHSNDSIWGLHIRRIIRHIGQVQNWSMIPIKNNGHVFSFGEMHGMKDLPKPKGIEFLPYVMGKYQREPKIEGSPYQKGNDWSGNVGLDAKFALSDFTLDLTVNPDFGQVELDPSVMNLTAYETFYDEKRPFFLEGKHILDFTDGDDMMFYTRRIGAMPSFTPADIDNETSFAQTKRNIPIIGALKLTGTNRKGVTIGVLQSLTARSSAKVTRDGMEDKVIVEPLTNYTLGRVQKNWKGNTLLGAMITSVNRSLEEPYLEQLMIKNAFTAGIDFTHYFKNRLYYIDMKGMFSSLNGDEEAIARVQMNPVHYYQRTSATDYLGVDYEKRSLTGTGGYVKVGRKGNSKWTFAETFSWRSPGFDLNDIGYLKQADYLSNETSVEYKQTEIWKIFRTNILTFSQENKWDYGGNALNNSIGVKWRMMFLNRYELTLNENFGWNWMDTRQLRGGPDIRYDPYFYTDISFNTNKSERVSFSMNYTGDHNTDGKNKLNTFSPALNFRLGNHVHLSGQYNFSWNKDNLQYVTTINHYEPHMSVYTPATYLMGYLEQKTYGITMRLQVNVTPDISLQFYGSPFTSIGKYTDFKKAADTKSHTYNHRFETYNPNQISLANGIYSVQTENESFQFSDPNFSFNEFRSNLVARWEYLPGSTLYFVWEHRMSDRKNEYISGFGNNLDRMFGLPTTNTFMIKLNYWFNL